MTPSEHGLVRGTIVRHLLGLPSGNTLLPGGPSAPPAPFRYPPENIGGTVVLSQETDFQSQAAEAHFVPAAPAQRPPVPDDAQNAAESSPASPRQAAPSVKTENTARVTGEGHVFSATGAKTTTENTPQNLPPGQTGGNREMRPPQATSPALNPVRSSTAIPAFQAAPATDTTSLPSTRPGGSNARALPFAGATSFSPRNQPVQDKNTSTPGSSAQPAQTGQLKERRPAAQQPATIPGAPRQTPDDPVPVQESAAVPGKDGAGETPQVPSFPPPSERQDDGRPVPGFSSSHSGLHANWHSRKHSGRHREGKAPTRQYIKSGEEPQSEADKGAGLNTNWNQQAGPGEADPRVMELRQSFHALMRKQEAEGKREKTTAPPPAAPREEERQPPPLQQVVVIRERRQGGGTRQPAAFWERSYMARMTLRTIR